MPKGALMLVSILITFLVVILVLYLINMLPLDGRAKQIARVVVIVLGVISLLRYISIYGDDPNEKPRPRPGLLMLGR